MIKQLVVAKATQHLYHGTSITAAAAILAQDAFVLKPASGTTAEEKLAAKDAPYYLSTARSINSDYIQRLGQSWLAILELDGMALATKYKIRPVDYWGARDHRNEAEDRVLSRTPTIKAMPYIKRVYAVVPHNPSDKQKLALRSIAILCKRNKIRVAFYAAADGNFDPRKQKPIALDLSLLKTDPNAKSYNNRPYGHLTGWLALYKMPISERPNLRQHERAYARYRNLAYSDAVNVLNADLHNSKGDANPKDRRQLEEMTEILRKNRWDTKAFIAFLKAKWNT